MSRGELELSDLQQRVEALEKLLGVRQDDAALRARVEALESRDDGEEPDTADRGRADERELVQPDNPNRDTFHHRQLLLKVEELERRIWQLIPESAETGGGGTGGGGGSGGGGSVDLSDVDLRLSGGWIQLTVDGGDNWVNKIQTSTTCT